MKRYNLTVGGKLGSINKDRAVGERAVRAKFKISWRESRAFANSRIRSPGVDERGEGQGGGDGREPKGCMGKSLG